LTFCKVAPMVVLVNDTTALAEIHRLAQLNRIRLTRHAAERMDQRRAKREDVRAALVSSTVAIAQERGWRVEGGVDRDGDELTVVVDIEADVIVITLF
jgi:2-methylaconitate cis-trans-isomerase PrpF